MHHTSGPLPRHPPVHSALCSEVVPSVPGSQEAHSSRDMFQLYTVGILGSFAFDPAEDVSGPREVRDTSRSGRHDNICKESREEHRLLVFGGPGWGCCINICCGLQGGRDQDSSCFCPGMARRAHGPSLLLLLLLLPRHPVPHDPSQRGENTSLGRPRQRLRSSSCVSWPQGRNFDLESASLSCTLRRGNQRTSRSISDIPGGRLLAADQ